MGYISQILGREVNLAHMKYTSYLPSGQNDKKWVEGGGGGSGKYPGKWRVIIID